MTKATTPHHSLVDPMGWTLGFLLCSILLAFLMPKSPRTRFPVVNRYRWDYFQTKAKHEFERRAQELIEAGLKQSAVFDMETNMGPRVVISDKFADAVGMDDRLDQHKGITPINLAELIGFETMFTGSIHNHIPRPAASATSKRLVHLTQPFSEETAHFLEREWGDCPEWLEIDVLPMAMRLTAQLTSRAFVGPRLCRDLRWLEIATTYVSVRLAALMAVQKWAKPLHPLVHWFLPSCRKLRAQIKLARELIQPELDRLKDQTLQDESFTSLAWIHHNADGYTYDAGLAQLRLSAVANHTTSDMLMKVLFRICENPQLIPVLREEIITTVRSGLRVAALQKMWLLESLMKESQRLEPFFLLSMFRYATETVILPDGTVIPKGTLTAVANPSRLDPTIYPEPDKFDVYRFLKMRDDATQAGLAPFSKTNHTHLAFGHGKQACPGRFIAINEVKLALCHILLKYDIDLVDGSNCELVRTGLVTVRNPAAKIRVRRRQEEVKI
ncbi:hypothetical protein N7541_011083 [Penicillium brevicompactum]|uniref:Uncharacterized protein n=1 Tax=Penicillium brevicompactum TaxID=5074 RepID=A0A9W9UIT8_PENBR|nr:hypothetical protein N7541_011083 [Penicillium brevicompactum]